jgi:hypothetical protein
VYVPKTALKGGQAMEWIHYRRLFHIAHSEYKRCKLIARVEAIIIAALVAVVFCQMR